MEDDPIVDEDPLVAPPDGEGEAARPVEPGQTGYLGGLATGEEAERPSGGSSDRGREPLAIQGMVAELRRQGTPRRPRRVETA